MTYSFSRTQSIALAAVLGVAAATGWWTGAYAQCHSGPSGGRTNTQAASQVVGTKTTDATFRSAAQPEASKLLGEQSPALQEELLSIIKSGVIDGGGKLKKFDDGVKIIRQAARAACLLSKLTQLQQAAVFGHLPEAGRGEALKMLKMFSSMMTDREPGTSSGYAARLAGPHEEMERYVILSKWAANDPAGLLQYWKTEAVKPAAPHWLKSGFGTSLREIGLADPRLLMREAMTGKDSSLRLFMLDEVHLNGLYTGDKSQWADDSDGLLKQLMSQKPDRRENELSAVLAMRLKHESPEEARAWVESLELGPDSKTWTEKSLLSAWRGQDRAAAAQWMLDHTPPEQRADSIAEYVGWWTNAKLPNADRLRAPEADIAGCADWILSLGISPDTEKGISVLAEGWILAGEPAAALAWAQAISDPATRTTCLDKVTTQIERRYPDTWRAMLTAAGAAR